MTFATVYSLMLNIFSFITSTCSSDAGLSPGEAPEPGFGSASIPRAELVRIRGELAGDRSTSVSFTCSIVGESPSVALLVVLACLLGRIKWPLDAIVRLLFNIVSCCGLPVTFRVADSAFSRFKP